MMNFPLNISNHGSVPKKSQTFCITLPCVHQSIPSVDISMQINFTMQTNITLLNVLMKKECTTGNHALLSKENHYFYNIINLEFICFR